MKLTRFEDVSGPGMGPDEELAARNPGSIIDCHDHGRQLHQTFDMTNRLVSETSPYLRQHANNPVDWYPWGDEAFEAARSLDRPILLSIGYSSCHWCHVMAHESFENEETAQMMNTGFINIKVDREERPDIDAIYMEATQAMIGSGGWPMTVFMTPSAEPFFCGTYFPADSSRGSPTFRQLLGAITEVWRDRREELLEQSSQLVQVMSHQVSTPDDAQIPGVEMLAEATVSLLKTRDRQWGGFGTAPKFPQTMSLLHLLREHHRSGSTEALDAVVAAVDAMAAGGIHDQLGGGFSRYSVDEKWLVPHFEKMLYDNALMTRIYLQAWLVTGEERFLQTCTDTIEYVLDSLSHPDGGRYSAEDADSLPYPEASHTVEGAFYMWTPDEVADVLAKAGLSEHLAETLDFYDITGPGNFEGSSIPNRVAHPGRITPGANVELTRAAMFAARSERPRPGLDDKVLTEWNALMVESLAEVAAAADNNRWLTEAESTAEFLCSNLRVDSPDGLGGQRWMRSWQADLNDGAGGAQHLGYAADYAALLNAFITLYEASGKLRWLDEAVETAEGLLTLFWDTEGGVWSTGDDAEALVARPKDIMDGATPSANSMTAVGLLRLEAHTGESRYGEHARSVLRLLGHLAAQHPNSFANLLRAIELNAVGITEVVITGDRPDLVRTVHSTFLPNAILAWGDPGRGPLWEGRTGETHSGTAGVAHVCTGYVCAAPSSSVEELTTRLREC
ncbi:MAG TPA: thioredoxin domain-containing protein [Microthrixaceae bacterium]|nr:thioredoxin domain-containing protein [Microthrixaceae bacterium]